MIRTFCIALAAFQLLHTHVCVCLCAPCSCFVIQLICLSLRLFLEAIIWLWHQLDLFNDLFLALKVEISEYLCTTLSIICVCVFVGYQKFLYQAVWWFVFCTRITPWRYVIFCIDFQKYLAQQRQFVVLTNWGGVWPKYTAFLISF